MPSIVDFRSSSVGWILKSNTIGLFKISSSLKSIKSKKIFFLAEIVMAGNVFGKKELPIIPHYFYQWCTDGKSRVVYRVSKNGNFSSDKKKKIIKRFLLNLRYKKLIELPAEYLFKSKNLLNEGLTCRIIYNNQLCEFLINHINLDKKQKQFQIETGPVLLMKNNKPTSAFIFINSINECQVVWNYPSLGQATEKINIKLKFFIHAKY